MSAAAAGWLALVSEMDLAMDWSSSGGSSRSRASGAAAAGKGGGGVRRGYTLVVHSRVRARLSQSCAHVCVCTWRRVCEVGKSARTLNRGHGFIPYLRGTARPSRRCTILASLSFNAEERGEFKTKDNNKHLFRVAPACSTLRRSSFFQKKRKERWSTCLSIYLSIYLS